MLVKFVFLETNLTDVLSDKTQRLTYPTFTQSKTTDIFSKFMNELVNACTTLM